MNKTLKLIIFTYMAISVLSPAYAFKARILTTSKNRKLSCLPVNAVSPGTKISSDFGKTYTVCSGFSCGSGTPNTTLGTCVVAVYNMVCIPNGPCSIKANEGLLLTGRFYTDGYGNPSTTNYSANLTQRLNCPDFSLLSYGSFYQDTQSISPMTISFNRPVYYNVSLGILTAGSSFLYNCTIL